MKRMSKRLEIRLPVELYEEIHRLAEGCQRSVSSLCRLLIADGVERETGRK